ncbi:MAG TPA: hypothetical protein DCY13_05975, partial [Verrucomicrobiales bacterium]|nr:hypothetical protein [Verrucomicrobiales bacterium]
FHPPVAVARTADLTSPSGVRLRAYHPAGFRADHLPGIVYFHGGGWVMGDLETHDTLCRHLANAAGAVVIAVDYRLAPENPFPAAFDDAVAAVRHVAEISKELGIDPGRLAVAGDSAGGNLAAAVCLHAREQGGPAIALQCLLYPVLDAGCDTAAYTAFADGHGLTRDKMRFFWKSYLGTASPENPYAVPLAAENLSGLPPALVLTAEYDVLRDEGEQFGKRLVAAGVEVEMIRCEGVIHGFLHYAGAIRRGQSVLREVGQLIAARLAPGRNP